MDLNQLRAEMWKLCQYRSISNLQQLSDTELAALVSQALTLRTAMQNNGFSNVELDMISGCCNTFLTESQRRGLNLGIMPVEIVLSVDGTFTKGEDELRYAFRQLDFDDMMSFVDDILAKPLNEAQRMAIINLARDRIYADSAE